MITTVSDNFEILFAGSEGIYRTSFSPIDPWDGYIDVSIDGQAMRWAVIDTDRGDEGLLVLGGMTTGSRPIWNEEFWFELHLDDDPPIVRYWSEKMIWREDHSVSTNGR